MSKEGLKRFWQNLRYGHNVWIKIGWLMICMGRLPMAQREPLGVWMGRLDQKPIVPGSRYAPKQFKWTRHVVIPYTAYGSRYTDHVYRVASGFEETHSTFEDFDKGYAYDDFLQQRLRDYRAREATGRSGNSGTGSKSPAVSP